MSIRFESVGVMHSGGVRAIDDVSVEIPPGQFCVFLGPSGAGKTTLLKTVNGLVRPTSGATWLNGRRVERKNVCLVRRKVSMIHQQIHLVARLTVERNVLSGAVAALPLWKVWANRAPLALRAKAARLCRQVGLEPGQFQRRAASLSGGQQQRVGIARAFILEPEVVLADEPVASLDPENSREILSILRQAARDYGTTVLCSLHQVDLAREFADRVVGMRSGRVHCDVAPGDLSEDLLRSLYETEKQGVEREKSDAKA